MVNQLEALAKIPLAEECNATQAPGDIRTNGEEDRLLERTTTIDGMAIPSEDA